MTLEQAGKSSLRGCENNMAIRKASDAEFLEAWDRLKSVTLVANELGMTIRRAHDRRRMIEAKLGLTLEAKPRGKTDYEQVKSVLQGFSPEHELTHPVPSPLIVRGTTNQYGSKGELERQWVKTKLDDTQREAAMFAAIDALSEKMPRAKPTKSPKAAIAELCTLYTLTDCHVGMRAWAPEAGEDWDLEIAERTLKGAIKYLIDASPAAATCLLNQLGDWLHFDSLASITPTSGHLLDADSRFPKVVAVATRILRYAVDSLLQKHAFVIVLMAEGNHDMASSVWLRHIFGLLYENEPRVKVMDSELPYYVHVHGKNMLAFHHGHLKKNDQLPLLFAAQYPKEWGATTKRYCHTGHRHHVEEKEHSGMTVIQHATIAARDAYAARGGWIAERKMKAITYHDVHGERSTVTVTPEMLLEAA